MAGLPCQCLFHGSSVWLHCQHGQPLPAKSSGLPHQHPGSRPVKFTLLLMRKRLTGTRHTGVTQENFYLSHLHAAQTVTGLLPVVLLTCGGCYVFYCETVHPKSLKLRFPSLASLLASLCIFVPPTKDGWQDAWKPYKERRNKKNPHRRKVLSQTAETHSNAAADSANDSLSITRLFSHWYHRILLSKYGS